jgi:hypothetical protein
MKIFYTLLAFLLLASAASSKAQAIVMDSVWADSIYLDISLGVQSPELTLHEADNKFGVLGNGAEFSLMFKNKTGTAARVIKPNATINVYCKKDTKVDSSAGLIAFVRTDAEGVILDQSPYFLLGDGINTITVPNSSYTYALFQLSGLGDPNGAKSFMIDAVQLIQEEDKVNVPRSYTESASRITGNYPNPFVSGTSGGTTLVFSLEREADIVVLVVDALGREVAREPLGMMQSGTQKAQVQVKEAGLYIARLIVDGELSGSAYKLIAK